jgi:hypothetical protein
LDVSLIQNLRPIDQLKKELAMPRLTESQWINLFLRRLGSLEPALDIVNAMRYPMKAYGDAPDLEPEGAAESYVGELALGRWSQTPATRRGAAAGQPNEHFWPYRPASRARPVVA